MWRATLCVACCILHFSVAYQANKRLEKNDMEMDDLEFPLSVPVPDNIAGAPGSNKIPDVYITGSAHKTLMEGAADPCNMEDEPSPSSSPVPSPTNSISPSPSPSPSDFLSYEESVNTKALTVIGVLATKACVNIDRRIINSLSESLADLKSTDKPTVLCKPVAQPMTRKTALISKTDAYVDNDLAGYTNQPVIADARAAVMNENFHISEQLLVDIFRSERPVDIDAFRKVVLLFGNNVDSSLQCDSAVPPLSELLTKARNISTDCPQMFGTGVSDVLPASLLPSITKTYITTLFKRIADVLHIKIGRKPAPVPSPLVQPMPRTLTTDPPTASEAMTSSTKPKNPVGDCVEEVYANSFQSEDFRKNPGHRDVVAPATTEAVDLPAFGAQKLDWGARNFDAIVMNEAPPFQPVAASQKSATH